jgi:hypothetical protein
MVKGGETIMNAKYEITGIAHEKYPFLHRIRALRDIGSEIKAGDLGGFVESEGNLSFEAEDDAWIFNDAIAAGEGHVDKGSVLRERAIVCGCAYASHGTEMSGDSRAEDDAYIRGARLSRCARVSGNGMVLQSPTTKAAPILTGSCSVYGKVIGDVTLTGTAVVISGEEILNESLDTLIIDDRGRTIIRAPSRDELAPCQPQEKQKKPKNKGRDR